LARFAQAEAQQAVGDIRSNGKRSHAKLGRHLKPGRVAAPCGVANRAGRQLPHHRQAQRRERDRFLDRAFAQAGVPLLRFRVQRARYRPAEIRAVLMSTLGDAKS